ncbi:epoxide hydrolase 4 isoform X2 [Ptiloglossa arizonensis]|uniref:epoxide hydrolase 4 isoform X2 n=1 Tax=Ptiloglossa arizonensis TaxID=3350558 RepID=UPI003FA0A220
MITNDKIVHISTWEIVKLHFFSFIYGLYLIVKRFFKWAWDPKTFFMMQQRDKPPPCLVDNNLGTHSYVKIKKLEIKINHLYYFCMDFLIVGYLGENKYHALLNITVAIDMKGFGDSDKPSIKRSYKIEILIEELKQFILTLGVKQCSIIGHDLGGLLGWYLVALYGDMIDKFVTISCPHPNFYWNRMSGNSVFDSKWVHFSRLPFLPEIDALKEDLSIINYTFQHIQLDQTNNGKNYVEAYKYAFSRKEDWTGAINYYRNLPFIRLNTESSEQIYTRTLCIIGNMDPLVTIENIVQCSEYVENFTVKVISGAQHFPHQQKPEAVNKAILKFFMGTTNYIERTPSKSIMSSWLGSLSNTVKYKNHMFDIVHKKTSHVANVLPSKVLYLGQTTS